MLRAPRLFILSALWLLSSCFAPERLPATGPVTRHSFRAQAVDETYQLFVRLPPGYDDEPARNYPLVVQLDANLPLFEEFDVTAGLASSLEASGQLQPTIIVGVGYGTGQQAAVNRFRDLGLKMENETFRQTWSAYVSDGDAPKFLRVLRDELLPHLQSQYRLAGPEGRALFGHSLGGLFAVFALTQHRDAAPAFRHYVVASPSFYWDAGQLFTLWQRDFREPVEPVTLFTAAGALEGPEMMAFFDEFTERVRAEGHPRLVFDSLTLQTDHVGSCAPGFRNGLLFLAAHGFGGTP